MQTQEQNAAYMEGSAFKHMLKALRLYTKSDAADVKFEMIELWFQNGGVTGYACDGYKVIRYFQPCTCSSEFMTYIRSPRLWPYDKDLVAIQDTDEEKATVSFGEVQFTYKRPIISGDATIRDLFEKLQREMDSKEDCRSIFCNNRLLHDVATSLVEASQNAERVSITLGPSPINPIRFASSNAEAFLLPIRPPRKELDT